MSYAEDCEADGFFETRVYTWIAIDPCGNTNKISFTINLVDDVAPVLTDIPADELVVCRELPPVGIIHVNDFAVDVDVTYIQSILPGPSSGTFDVQRTWTATDPCGNTSAATQHITWIPDTQIECEIDLPAQPVCNTHGVPIGATITGGLGGYEYEWNVDGVDCYIQSGQGTPEITIYVGFSVVDISLRVTDGYGCSTLCTASLDCDDPFGDFAYYPDDSGNIETDGRPVDHQAAGKSNADQLFLWPNPAKDNLNLRYHTSAAGDVSCTILDIAGPVVFNENFSAFRGLNRETISMAEMTEGMYLVNLKVPGGVMTEVFVVMR